MSTFKVGQRVKFIDPDTYDSRIGTGLEARGRIVHIILPLVAIIVDGKAFAQWVHTHKDKVKLEHSP